MKTVRIYEFGGLDSLKLEDVPVPVPASGEVLIRIHGASINPVDWKTCIGQGVAPRLKDPFPFNPGWDVSGIIEAVGANVAALKTGDAVCGMIRWPLGGGGYAEYVAAPATDVVIKPATMSHLEAAGLPLVALTAWQGLFDIAELSAGQKVLIHAAAGGVGHIAVQLAKWQGATVIGTASARNEEFLRNLGLDVFIDYNARQFEDLVHDVDVVFDGAGGDVQERSWSGVKKGGMLASIRGRPSEQDATARGVRAHHVSVHTDQKQLQEIADLVEAGHIKVHVGATFPLAKIRDAHELSQQGHGRGKIVLQCSN